MPEVYGTAFIETAKDKIAAQLDTLKTTMAAYDPTFSYVYEKHSVAKMQLNAVSVDFDGLVQNEAGANDYSIRWLMQFSIRVHTAYSDGIKDGEKNSRLLNSIINQLQENKHFGDTPGTSYRLTTIGEVTNRNEFAESDTFGGQLICAIEKTVEYAQ